MKKILNRIFSYPRFFDLFLYAGKYAAIVQLLAALVFLGMSRSGAPLGCLTYVEQFLQAALTTVTLTAGFAGVAQIMRRYGMHI